MNQSNIRKSILKKLEFATSVIELAKAEDITDDELLETIEIIQIIHQEKATTAMEAHSFGDMAFSTGKPVDPQEFQKILDQAPVVNEVGEPEPLIK